MPRTVIITPNVRQRLRRYIYNITINPNVKPKYKVDTFRQAIDKANTILNDLYQTLSNEFVLYKPTQFNVLGRSYGYRQYQYKDKSSKTVWLFGCDTTPLFNFVMIMQNSKPCLSHVEHQGNIIIENKQYNTMKNTRNKVRLTESQLHQVINESVKKILSELDWKTYMNAAKKTKSFNRSNKFYKIAQEQFKQDYGKTIYGKDNQPYCYFELEGNAQGDLDNNNDLPHVVGFRKSDFFGSIPDTYEHGMHFSDTDCGYMGGRRPADAFFPNEEMVQAYQDADNECKKYIDGNYKYVKGKGWHLNDSLDESIRRAIKKVLK